jgi:Putative zinc-finger
MEHAPLRPVPARPAGPIDPATALREIGSWLPTLSPVAARALALVVLAERPRAEVAASLEVSEADLGALLAEARKELRQTVVVLGGTGWCERAEGLISDRLDGALAERDVRRLDVHLRNCSRCVEHERRLVQATDALVRSLGGRPSPTVAPPVPLVEAPEAPAQAEPPAGDGIEGPVPDEATLPSAAEPDELAPGRDQIAAAAEVLVAARTRRQIAAAVAWNALIAIAVLLTLAVIALTVAGILGAEL